jgi:hypothetical protein
MSADRDRLRSVNTARRAMIYELRFENKTLRIWEKHGIRQAGFWATLIGKSSQEITYTLAWDSMAEREKRCAFLADLEWVAVVAKTEKDGELVENISSQLQAPAAFSAVR